MRHAQKAGLVLGLLASAISPGLGQPAKRAPVTTTPHFVFYSDFEPNLNDALINVGIARKFRKPQLFHDGDEAACFNKLAAPVRSAWERAADYYAEIISPSGSNSHERYLLRVQLAGLTEELKDADARQFVDIVPR